MLKKIFLFLIITLLINCRPESDAQSRIYVEGKVTTISPEKVGISIIVGNKLIAKTSLNSNGNFILSGPVMQNEGFAVVVNNKIKTFSSTTPNLTLSTDALQIIAPKSVTYLKFNEIILEK